MSSSVVGKIGETCHNLRHRGRCLRNLTAYRPHKPKFPYPRSRSAAVLVALFVGRMGDLYVLLNRSAHSNIRLAMSTDTVKTFCDFALVRG